MANPLSASINMRLQELGVPTVCVSGLRHTRPQSLQPLKRQPAAIKQLFDEMELPDSTRDRMENQFIHSTLVTDETLKTRGFTILCEEPPYDVGYDVFEDIFIRTAMNLPDLDNPLEVPELTIASMLLQPQTNKSAGLLPLNTLHGSATGSKDEMHTSAVHVNIMAGTHPRGTPATCPNNPVQKTETIKHLPKPSKVRTIQVESQANYMVLKHFFEGVLNHDRDIASGRAIGMSTLHGEFKTILTSWFEVYTTHYDGDWNEFLEWLELETINESDKSAWESSTNVADGLPMIMGMLARIKTPLGDFQKRLLCRSLADYINPAIQIDGNRVFFAEWRIAGGTYLTAYGNTERHRSMNFWLCDFLERHGGYGNASCECFVCAHFGEGPRVEPIDIEFMRRAFVMGDDYLAICRHPERFNTILDFVFKTKTKTVIKQFFSEPDLLNNHGAEFLKKHFYLDKSEPLYNVRTFREAGRKLAKLYHGESSRDPSRLYAAVMSGI